jgi:cytochrome c oxidase subunit 2
VRYPATTPDGDVVTANEIHLPVGREVVLAVTSPDVIHSLWIPNLHGKIDMIPGQVNTLRVLAERPGVMRGQCAEYCGAQHALMALYVVAEPPEHFEAWLSRQRQPVAPPEEPFLARGMQVFGTAGCGACHAVRGTEWNGRLGPDLSRVGSRLSLAAGVLGNHRGTLAGWIAAAQDIKPENRMPSFASALDGPELRALAAWLESLK